MKNITNAIAVLNQSDDHQVIIRYKKPEFYNLNADISKKVGVFLDIVLCASYTRPLK
ncbi:MAG: hypothetical protein HON78_02975 [Legionellales bacterium]|nr:hypothetical protein [Legionellales bacterium]